MKNTLINCQGQLTLEEAGRVAEWPRKLLITLPYGDGRNKWYRAIYDIYDWKSNPSCKLLLCPGCHRPQATGCYSDCRFAQTGRREELALARAQEKETKEQVSDANLKKSNQNDSVSCRLGVRKMVFVDSELCSAPRAGSKI